MKGTYKRAWATLLVFVVWCLMTGNVGMAAGEELLPLPAGQKKESEIISPEERGVLTALEAWQKKISGSGNTEEVLLPSARDWQAGGLPSRYDAGDQGKRPVVKSQGNFGTCWALVVTSVLEAAWMKQEHLIFSADHMSLNNGFHITQDEGGDYMMAMAYLSGWRGPVLEEEDPYGDGLTEDGLKAAIHVQEMQLLEGMSREDIKQMIYEYGPVQTSLYLDRRTTASGLDYYQQEAFAYYYPEKETPTHDVVILGWDDTYSRENFKITPQENGAFICQNSWGEKFGDQGIFYVSYEDANIARGGVAYTRVESSDNYDRIYQTDVCGWQGQQGYDEPSCYFANVYTAKSNENLAAVGFYTTDVNSAYEIYAVSDFEDETSFEKRKFLQRGWIRNSGYFTIDLEAPLPLEAGERFAVIVKITTPGATNPVVVELHKDVYSETVTLEGKEGYLSLQGELWEPTEEKFGTNVCLKAYTRRTD